MDEMVAQPSGAAPEGLVAEVAAFAKETGQTFINPMTQTQPEQTPVEIKTEPMAQPVEAAKTVEVPEKFKTQDGQADLSKVEKSTAHAQAKTADIEAQIAAFRAEEKRMHQRQNELNALKREVIPPVAQQPVYPQPQAGPVDLMQITPQNIMQDLIENGATVDEAKKQANTMYKLALLARQSAYQEATREARQEVAAIRENVEAREMAEQFRVIAKSDPWILSTDALNTLAEIRQNYPHLNSAAHPWLAAYDQHLANQYKQQRAGTVVNTPTPKAQAALVAPVSAPSRPEAAPQINFADRRAYEPRLNQMSDDNALDFLAKELSRRGMKVKR